MSRIAIIGAGLSGLTCARALVAAGHRVQIFDKGRGPGGRLAGRRHEYGAIDHGAQYFTVRDPGFAELVEEWQQAGVVAPWHESVGYWHSGAVSPARGGERFLGTPRMNSCLRHSGEGLDIQFNHRLSHLSGEPRLWFVHADNQPTLGPFDAVLCTAPAPQSAELLRIHPSMGETIASCTMDPCWALLLWLEDMVEDPWAGMLFDNHPCLAWYAWEQRKPGRSDEPRLCIHANAEWSQRFIEAQGLAEVAPMLTAAMEEILSQRISVRERQGHRWRFAKPAIPLGQPCLFDPQWGLGAAGDWCLDARLEAAWCSGKTLAEAVIASAVDSQSGNLQPGRTS